MPEKKSQLEPEVYYVLREVTEQRKEINDLAKEVRDFHLETHGRITKLETKAGIIGFVGGALSGVVVKFLVDFLTAAQ